MIATVMWCWRASVLSVLVSAAAWAGSYSVDFGRTPPGRLPGGWQDLVAIRPSANWAIDRQGFLRPVLKHYTGLIVRTDASGRLLRVADGTLAAEFKLTEDESVSFGLVGRLQDERNYYLARFTGGSRLELIRVRDGVEEALDRVPLPAGVTPRTTGQYARDRLREGRVWSLSLTLRGKQLTARVHDETGREQVRLDALDDGLAEGTVGLRGTTFAAARNFRLETDAEVAGLDAAGLPVQGTYDLPAPEWRPETIDRAPAQLAPTYDVIVAGAGTGGWAAAIQAARLGARVLLLEETDWIGGQMSAAAVTTMDEAGLWKKFPVRERGLYREFHEAMVTYYYTLGKDPFVTYHAYPDQLEGGYEPKATRAQLYGFIRQERERGATLDLAVRARVVTVRKAGAAVTGVTVEFAGGAAPERRDFASKVLVDATEYGDVIPLAGARYRVGNGTSDQLDPAALVQDHTWTAVLCEYPDGVPAHLQIKTPPPGYEKTQANRYKRYQVGGALIWGGVGKGLKIPRDWRVYFAWRGMADADSPLTGERSSLRHTQCGFNGGNDYPVTAATIEDPAQRLVDEREGIYRTLGTLYYFQQVLGLNWSLAEDEGYATPYNRAKMHALGLRPDLEALAVHLPQQPYVRECRRIIGLHTLVANDLTRFEHAKHFATSVAMGDYFMDLDHGKTAHAVEAGLDSGEPPRGSGPFQVPFEVFIPETVDGFIPAEKNISQSRLANGATRLQPITMLTGQAAGAIAALAARRGVAPRALPPVLVQAALLEAGSTLIQRWYADVAWGTPLWRATQLLSLHKVLDAPGPLDQKEGPIGGHWRWRPDDPLAAADATAAQTRLRELARGRALPLDRLARAQTRGEFAVAAADALVAAFAAR
jgi:hypothetical protein